jgi:hypothetical protein
MVQLESIKKTPRFDLKPLEDNFNETSDPKKLSWELGLSVDELTKLRLLTEAQKINFSKPPLESITNWDKLRLCHKRALYCDLLGYTPQETASILGLKPRSITTYLVVAKKDTGLDYSSRNRLSRKLFHSTKIATKYAKKDRLFEFITSKKNPNVNYANHIEFYNFLNDVIRYAPGSNNKSKKINQTIIRQGIMQGLNDQEILNLTGLNKSVLSSRKAKIKSWFLDVITDYFSFKDFFEKAKSFIEIFQFNKEQRKLFLAYLNGSDIDKLKASSPLSSRTINRTINKMKRTLGTASVNLIHESGNDSGKTYLDRFRGFIGDLKLSEVESCVIKSKLSYEERVLLSLHLKNLSQKSISEFMTQRLQLVNYSQPKVCKNIQELKLKIIDILNYLVRIKPQQ